MYSDIQLSSVAIFMDDPCDAVLYSGFDTNGLTSFFDYDVAAGLIV